MSSIERAYGNMVRQRYGLHDILDGNGQIPDSRKEHFIYGTDEEGVSLATAAGSTGNLGIQISQEADFICTKMVSSSIKGATTNTWSVEMVTGDTSRQLQNAPIPQDSFFGTAQLPGIMSMPRIFWRNTTITFKVTREVAGSTNPDVIWIALWGYKVFYDMANLNLTTRNM